MQICTFAVCAVVVKYFGNMAILFFVTVSSAPVGTVKGNIFKIVLESNAILVLLVLWHVFELEIRIWFLGRIFNIRLEYCGIHSSIGEQDLHCAHVYHFGYFLHRKRSGRKSQHLRSKTTTQNIKLGWKWIVSWWSRPSCTYKPNIYIYIVLLFVS